MERTFWARSDSNTANNPALNLTGAAPTQITFVESGANGDLILDNNNGNPDPDTQVQIGGVDYSLTYELAALLPTKRSDGSVQVPDQFEGHQVYIITVQDYPSLGGTTRLAFLPESNATEAQMASFGNGAISLQMIDTSNPGAVCFAEGTYILTPTGEVRVETLLAGDLLCTHDDGVQPIIWMSTSRHSWPGSAASELPVLISQGAFGQGMPHRNLEVSPQHCILLSDDFEGSELSGEVLAPSKGLCDLPGIRIMKGKRSVTFHHILMARHMILLSEGLPTESFYPGPTALKMLSLQQRSSVLALCPQLLADPASGYGPRARCRLTVQQARHLGERLKSRKKTTKDPSGFSLREAA